MKFSFGGSAGNWWNKMAKNFRKADTKVFGGEFGKFTSNLKTGSEYLQTQGGGTIGEGLLHTDVDFTPYTTGDQNVTEHWGRQLSPLWEGGLSGQGGSLHQDLLPWMEETGMKASHHLMGTEIPGYGSGDSDDGGGSSAVVTSETEDPSLINQGNWQNPDTIASFLRREDMLNRGGLATDLTKSKRGRLSVANLS